MQRDNESRERGALCLPRHRDSPLQRFETFVEGEGSSAEELKGENSLSVTEHLTLRVNDESRVAAALVDSSKKRKTGSVFSVEVDLSQGEMGLGVKILKNNILVVSMLKRVEGCFGPGETAGLRLGDIIFGANFRPCIEGVRSLLHNVKVSLRGEKKNSKCDSVNEGEIELCEKDHKYHRPVITLQCWRCHQLCSDPIPGRLFPRADDVFVQGYSLFRSRVLSEWERWNFNEILLEYLKRELKIRLEDEVKMINTHGSNPRIRVIHNEVLDLERNILRAKGLRTALCVRIVHTKFVDDAVLYVLRVEDEESGLQWNVRKRYNDFYSLHKELSGMSKYLTDIPFPRKRIVSSKLSLRVIEERIVALEQFMRQGVHRLTQYATSDAQASQSLRRVQEFLDVSMFINCLKPPPIDDQRYLELMIYRRLNDFSSLACQQCIRFVDSVDLDAVAQNNMSNGYLPMLELVAQALREVEQYTAQQYGQQMNQILKDRRPNMPVDKVPSFVAKCIRRQVEGAIYLPLRRAIFRIVYSFIADKAERLQKSMKVLKRAPPKTFFEKGNYDELLFVKSLPAAISVFKDLVNAYLPSDQGNMLMRAAGAVMQVISDIEDIKKSKKSLDSLSEKKEALPSEEAAKTHSSVPDVELKPHQDGHRLNNSVNASQTPPKLKKTVSVDDLQFSGDKPHGYSNDLLNKSVLADPASTIFSAEDHVLVAKRDFDKDGSSVMQAQGEQEGEVGVVEGLVEDASLGNDAFRELYSIVKTEHNRGSRRDEEFEKTMQDMAAVALQATASSHVEKTWSGGDRGSLGGSDCESDELEAPVKCEQNNEDDDDDKEGDLDDDECDDDDEAPREGIPSGRKPPPVASAPVTAIRGSSVLRLEADSDPLFRPSQNRVETYISPFKKEPSAMQKQQEEAPKHMVAVGADDFLPMFTYVLVQSELPQLLLVKELMVTLVDNEEMYGECGYYLATLEAAVQHILQLADDDAMMKRSKSEKNMNGSSSSSSLAQQSNEHHC